MRSALAFFLSIAAIAIGCGDSNGGSSGGSGGTTASGGSSSGGATAGSAGTTGPGGSTASGGTTASGGAVCGDDVAPPNEILPDATDPEAGDFTLDEALVDLPEGPGPLRAIIETDLGTLTCTFHEDEAPIGVANFVGLARGRRAWKDPVAKKWVRRPYYDGLTFHRVIPDFVAQGGDPLGTGFGGPGYKFKNEIAGLTHVPGTLAYANAGPNTNGSQFYICETAQPQLDTGYTIFGECDPVSVVTAITNAPKDPNNNEKPDPAIHIVSVKITRCAE